LAVWKPSEYKLESDPLKTLFVYRLSYETDERKLKREFEMFGPIRSLCLIKDKEGKSRGYAFIEYENEKDYKSTP
jgi:U1 small nuclear ribonucleoprotein